MRRRFSATTLLLVAAVLIGGCGERPDYRLGLDGTVPVILDDFSIEPQKIVVDAGTIHLSAKNQGRLPHNLVVEQADVPLGVEPKVYGRTRTLQPGQMGTELRPFALPPGHYRLACTIGNHENLGQYGELVVVR